MHDLAYWFGSGVAFGLGAVFIGLAVILVVEIGIRLGHWWLRNRER